MSEPKTGFWLGGHTGAEVDPGSGLPFYFPSAHFDEWYFNYHTFLRNQALLNAMCAPRPADHTAGMSEDKSAEQPVPAPVDSYDMSDSRNWPRHLSKREVHQHSADNFRDARLALPSADYAVGSPAAREHIRFSEEVGAPLDPRLGRPRYSSQAGTPAAPRSAKGRSVQFVLANGETRAAVVTNTFPHVAEDRPNLRIELDAINDMPGGGFSFDMLPESLHNFMQFMHGQLHVGSVPYDAGKRPGTWHWWND